MPGPWLPAGTDPVAWATHSLGIGDYIKFVACDTMNTKQGTVLCHLDNLKEEEKGTHGQWTQVTSRARPLFMVTGWRQGPPLAV